MPTKKVKTTEVVSAPATAPKAAASSVKKAVSKPPVSSAAQPRAKAAASAHKTRTSSAAAPAAISTEQIADLAYYLWMDRGCPTGTSEEDWFRAESELRAKAGIA